MKRIKEIIFKIKSSVEGHFPLKNKKLQWHIIGVVFIVFLIWLISKPNTYERIAIKNYDSLIKENSKIEALQQTIENNNNELNDNANEISKLETEINTLKEKVEEAAPWFEMKEDERKAEEERLAAEKEAKAEEERLAKEKAEAEAKAQKEAEEQAKKEAEAHKYETGLTWEQIARDGMIGTLGQFEGRIIQVMDAEGYTQYRVAINDNSDNIMLVEITDDLKNETLLEDDYIYFKGTSMGTMTYTTVLGAEMTIPAFVADEITR